MFVDWNPEEEPPWWTILGLGEQVHWSEAQISLCPLPAETLPTPCLSKPPRFFPYTQRLVGGMQGRRKRRVESLLLSNFKRQLAEWSKTREEKACLSLAGSLCKAPQ